MSSGARSAMQVYIHVMSMLYIVTNDIHWLYSMIIATVWSVSKWNTEAVWYRPITTWCPLFYISMQPSYWIKYTHWTQQGEINRTIVKNNNCRWYSLSQSEWWSRGTRTNKVFFSFFLSFLLLLPLSLLWRGGVWKVARESVLLSPSRCQSKIATLSVTPFWGIKDRIPKIHQHLLHLGKSKDV